MKSRRYLWSTLAVSLIAAALSPRASAEIPLDIITAPAALNSAQQRTIDADVKKYGDQLVAGADPQVTDARSKLLDPLEKGPSETFRVAYSASVVAVLPKAMQSDRPIVRLNALIVAARMTDTGVVALVQTGLKDANPAVRYWAAKAVGQLAGTAKLDDAAQRQMLADLSAAVMKESAPDTLQQQLISMGKLNIPEAVSGVLTALNERVPAHAKDPHLPITADAEGLRQLYVKLVQDKANGKAVSNDAIRQLALVSFRYLAVAADQLDSGKLSADAQAAYWVMAYTADAALRWTTTQIAPSATQPTEIKDFISTHNPAGVKLRNEEWRKLLTTAPANFPAGDLAIK